LTVTSRPIEDREKSKGIETVCARAKEDASSSINIPASGQVLRLRENAERAHVLATICVLLIQTSLEDAPKFRHLAAAGLQPWMCHQDDAHAFTKGIVSSTLV